MLKHLFYLLFCYLYHQPPSGGCVLKQSISCHSDRQCTQPPSGGCVLKHRINGSENHHCSQPPSGGCVLKPLNLSKFSEVPNPAAFGRLCVETHIKNISITTKRTQPPSGGCVLKPFLPRHSHHTLNQPPSGGCVLKQCLACSSNRGGWPAAFGRLCVETALIKFTVVIRNPSRLRAAVC